MTARLPDWDTRFAAYLAEAAKAVRDGGEHYCALFGAGAVEALTGENPATAFRGRYSEVAAALEAVIDSLFPVAPVAFAQRGDLAWHDGSVGAVIGGDALFVGEQPPGTPGLARVPRREWEKAWKIG